MRHKIIKYRGFVVTKRELIADFIFLLVSFLITLIGIIIFNIHWSLYPGETLFPPSKTVGIHSNLYIIIPLIGSIVGFFMIKLFLIGVKEEIGNKKTIKNKNGKKYRN